MRVIHLAPTVFGTGGIFGGGERYPLELARAVARLVPCELVTFGPSGRNYRDTHGLRVRELRAVTHLGGHPAHPVSPALAGVLADADIVHTHHLRSTPSRIAAVLARLRGQHVVVTDHGLQGGDWHGLLPRLVDRFLLVSQFSARELRAPPARTEVIYGGVDSVRFHPDPLARRSGALFVGRITPHKGIDRLIEALPPGASLTIAGSAGHDARLPESGYPALLRRIAAGKDVRFVGPLADSELPGQYQRARVLVLPSVERTCYGASVPCSELLGLVVLEAMASGTPVICSRVGGIPEIVTHGETGYLVEPGNVGELQERLAQLLGDQQLAERLGRNARAQVLARFTWDHCARRCVAAYETLLAPASHARARMPGGVTRLPEGLHP